MESVACLQLFVRRSSLHEVGNAGFLVTGLWINRVRSEVALQVIRGRGHL